MEDFQQMPSGRTMSSQPKRKSSMPMVAVLKYLAVVLLLVLAGFGVYGLINYDRLSGSNDPAVKNAKVLASLKSTIILPDDEQPAVLEITNIDELKKDSADFYKYATNGDYLIIYTEKLKTAVLFSPTQKKILSIVPLSDEQIQALKNGNQSQQQNQSGNSTTPTE